MADGNSPDDGDVERVDRQYNDPNATDRDEYKQALKDEGFSDDAADAFADQMIDQGEARDLAERRTGDRDITTREDVEKAVMEDSDSPVTDSRKRQVAEAAAEDMGAPSESDLQTARGQALQNMDGSKLRSDPDLDPLAEGGQGREVADLDSAASLGKEGGLQTGVEKRGDQGIYYAEDSSGNRYPLSEVDL